MVYALFTLSRGGSHLTLTIDLSKNRGVYIREILRIGFPNLISMAAMSISFMVLNKLVSGIGQTEMNGWTMVGRMDQIVLIPSFAISGATIAMISQNFGRGNTARVRTIYRTNIILGIGVVALVAGVYIAASPLLFPFFSNVKEVVAAAIGQVRLVAITFTGVSAAIISTAAFQATGKPLPALVISLVRMGLISIPLALAFVFVFHLGFVGVLLSLAIGNLATLPISFAWTWHHMIRLGPSAVAAKERPAGTA
jgi:Na+-driven multidrug efflux pump